MTFIQGGDVHIFNDRMDGWHYTVSKNQILKELKRIFIAVRGDATTVLIKQPMFMLS